MSTTSIQQQRITVIDALRGFSLLGILILHAVSSDVWFFTKVPSEGGAFVMKLNHLLDSIIGEAMSNKFNTIFTLLFGVSFYIMLNRAEAKGVDFRWRFEWRLVILVLIGYFHEIIFPFEALLTYGMIGLPLVLFWKMKKKWILVSAIFCLLVYPFSHDIVNLLGLGANQVESVEFAEKPQFNSVISLFQYNIAQFRNPIAVFFDVDWFFKIFGLFLLGFYVASIGFFNNIQDKKKMYWFVLLISFALYLFFRLGAHYLSDKLYWYAHYCLSATYISGFILLYTTQAKKILAYMEPYGKLGLTNYIMQSVFGLLVFAPFFFGVNYLNTTHNVLVALAIYSIQAILSIWWLRYFTYGPFEWIWRSVTYLKIIPFRKKE